VPTVDLVVPLCSSCLKRWKGLYRRWLLGYASVTVLLAAVAGFLAFRYASFQKVDFAILAPVGVMGSAAVLLIVILKLLVETKPLPIQLFTTDTSAYVRFRNPRFVALMADFYQAADAMPTDAT
jgi:hypothetical protein